MWRNWRRVDGYAQLVRYVSVPALAGLALTYPRAEQDRRARRDDGPAGIADANRRTVERLYGLLKARELCYTEEPFTTVGQRIRDARWLDRGAGTCLDFALVFAAMCLDAKIPPILALTVPDAGDPAPGHAFVLADPERPWDAVVDPELDLGEPDRFDDGVFVVDRAGRPALLERLGARFVILDPSAASDLDRATFAEAVARGRRSLLAGADLVLIDLRCLVEDVELQPYELPEPDGAPTISRLLPSFPPFTAFDSRTDVVEALRAARGMVAIVGEQGLGKSMLAHHRAMHADDGCGWFLAATDRETLVTSLASAQAAQLGVPFEDADDVTRRELAAGARRDLESASGPWVVVLDNANADPADLRAYVPRADPERGQLLLVTSTNPAWAAEPGFLVIGGESTAADPDAVPLLPLSQEDVQPLVGNATLIELAGGRPLLVDSFVRLRALVGDEPIDAVASAHALDPAHPTAGPSLLWAVAHEHLSEDARRWAHAIAWLPPDDIPVGAVPCRDGATPSDVVAELHASGLIDVLESASDELEPERVSIHRLYVDAIRAHQATLDGEPARTVIELVGHPSAIALLDDSGDQATLDAILDTLLAAYEDAPAGGRLAAALRGIARLQELHGRITDSGRTYDLVATRLVADDPTGAGLDADDADVLADCLHGRARVPYHAGVKTQEGLESALADVELAIALREQHQQHEDKTRSEAFRGLLLRGLADFEPDDVVALAMLADAMTVIEAASEERRKRLGDKDPETARGIFNIGGGRIKLAQRDDPSRAAEHLAGAGAAYRTSLEMREGIYRRGLHPHVAASANGVGLHKYYEAKLLLADDPAARMARLREATPFVARAFEDRAKLDGDADKAATGVSGALLAKVILARLALSDPPAYRKAIADIQAECADFLGNEA